MTDKAVVLPPWSAETLDALQGEGLKISDELAATGSVVASLVVSDLVEQLTRLRSVCIPSDELEALRRDAGRLRDSLHQLCESIAYQGLPVNSIAYKAARDALDAIGGSKG